MHLDRRFGNRVPLEMYLNTYVADCAQRAFSVDLSEAGLYINTLPQDLLPPQTPVGLEFTLPGTRETIWAAGETCREIAEDYFHGRAVRFVAMAGLHSRMLRDVLNRHRLRRLFGAHRPALS